MALTFTDMTDRYTPAIPSLLSLPSTTPEVPLEPIKTWASHPHHKASLSNSKAPTQNNSIAMSNSINHTQQQPPAKPLPWLWRCHRCARIFPIGATRRCLEDGHFFCPGQESAQFSPVAKSFAKGSQNAHRKRRSRAGIACASEFDYAGWKAYGEWRRGVNRATQVSGEDFDPMELDEAMPKKHNCGQECDYPSECRWGRQVSPGTSSASSNEASTSFEEILGTIVSEEEKGCKKERTKKDKKKKKKGSFSWLPSIGDWSSPVEQKKNGEIVEAAERACLNLLTIEEDGRMDIASSPLHYSRSYEDTNDTNNGTGKHNRLL